VGEKFKGGESTRKKASEIVHQKTHGIKLVSIELEVVMLYISGKEDKLKERRAIRT